MVLELYFHIIMVLEFEQTEMIKILHDSFRIHCTILKFEPYRMKFDRENNLPVHHTVGCQILHSRKHMRRTPTMRYRYLLL
jgi:hypothetical protein